MMNERRIDIAGGEVVFNRKGLVDMIRKAEDGSYDITLTEHKENRRNQQNKFIHVCFDVYSKEIGLTPDEAKFYLKKRYGINGIMKDPQTGKQIPHICKTSSYNIEECSVFIDRILRHFEHDVGIIIDPDIRKQYKIDKLTGELKEI
jgi:hypothetical protein